MRHLANLPNSILWLGFIVSSLLLEGCATVHLSGLYTRPSPATRAERFLIQTDEYVILIAQAGDTLQSLAARFLNDKNLEWVIADFNNLRYLKPGQEVIIPLTSTNPVGVYTHGYQMVPILTYHQFGQQQGPLTVTPEMFKAQMAYLKAHDFRVIRLSDLQAFLQGEAPLPLRAVVITIDDGYKSVYTIAYPILKKYNFPATVFVYSDFIGLRSGLTWQDMQEMIASELIDIQPHSKTHGELASRQAVEDEMAYAHRIEEEIHHPAELIRRHLGLPIHTFSYPYGDTNDSVIARLKTHGYDMAATVQKGANAFFAEPFMLRRTQIYGDESLDAFKKNLDVFRLEKLL